MLRGLESNQRSVRLKLMRLRWNHLQSTPQYILFKKNLDKFEEYFNSDKHVTPSKKTSNKFDLDIGEIDREDESFSFPKKYFNTMNIPDKATIYVFDSFILSKTESSELLITMETTV